jgi:carnitine O-acetyltransferase
MAKFPSVLEALQDSRQREETRRAVQDFLRGDGPKLQEALLEYERIGIETGTWGSYVEEFWNESYLSPDASVVLNLNPFFVLEDAPDPKIAKDQLKRAAGLCFASIKIASLLQHETLSPDVFKGKPLCMDQFKALFGSSRQPSDGVSDEVHVYSDSSHGE